MNDENLPTEIKKHIFSFLDEDDTRIARLACTDWFKWLKHSKFKVSFATNEILPQVAERLSQYSYPIELTITSPHYNAITAGCLIHNISLLTQLSSFKLLSSYIYQDDVISPDDWYKLTNLTNMETWIFQSVHGGVPTELFNHFPRLKYFNQTDFSQADIVSNKCTKLEFLKAEEWHLNSLPVSLTHLELRITDDTTQIDSLSKLIKLKKLHIECNDDYVIDARPITGLETLTTLSMHIRGLEHCKKLKEIEIISHQSTQVDKEMMASAAALTQLQKLELSVMQCTNVTLSELTQLTSLTLTCHSVVLSSLPVSLQYLNLTLEAPHDYRDITHLTHLTQLEIDEERGDSHEFEEINNMTQLVSVGLSVFSPAQVSLSNLKQLTSLRLFTLMVDPQTLQQLTNLKELNMLGTSFTHEHWQSLARLSKLAKLSLYRPKTDLKRVDCTTIAHLPLTELEMKFEEIENFWDVIPKITGLRRLFVSSLNNTDQLLLLTSLNKLTSIVIYNKADGVTDEHLTSLTSLQSIDLFFKGTLYTVQDLIPKLTLLRSFVTTYKVK